MEDQKQIKFPERIEDVNPFQVNQQPSGIAIVSSMNVQSIMDIPDAPTKEQLHRESVPTLALKKQVIFGNIPSKSNCYKIITFRSKDPNKAPHASLGKTKVLKDYENNFFIQAGVYRNANIDGYFTLEVQVYYPSQRSDLDNSLKILLDCLQKINAVSNDNKCTRIVADKFLDKVNPRIEFTIKPSMK